MTKEVQSEQFAKININVNKNQVLKSAKMLKQDNIDIVGDKCIYNDVGKFNLTIDNNIKD